MCGIAGMIEWGRTGQDPDPEAVWGRTLTHRGPDGTGFVQRGRVALYHSRLSIVDLSDAGAQPMLSHDGGVASVVNGEIYNYSDLRRWLERRGVCLRSTCDCEVVPNLYGAVGERFLPMMRGMFALAVHDASTDTLLLARDRFGQKPLYYAQLADRFVFASELRSLIPFLPAPRLSELGVSLFLRARYVPAPHTIVDGVRKLMPGEALRVSTRDRTVRSHRWYELDPRNRPWIGAGFSDLVEQTRHRVTDAIQSRLMSDVPIGVFLSGGVDSAVLASELERMGASGLTCLTIDFPDASGRSTPDAVSAAALANRFGMKHRTLDMRDVGDPVEVYRDVFANTDEPDANPSCLATHLLSQAALHSGLKVVLSGDGADEAFLGYRRYMRHVARDLLTTMSPGRPSLDHLATSYARHRSSLPGGVLEDESPGLEAFRGLARRWLPDGLEGALGHVESTAMLDLRMWVPDMSSMRTDRLGMRNSLEIRSPFLDHLLQDFAASIPAARRLGRSRLSRPRPKLLLTTAFEDRLPPFVLSKNKQGFNTPMLPWLRRSLGPLIEDCVLEPSEWGILCDRSAVVDLMNTYVAKSPPSYFEAMFAHSVLNLSLWTRQNLTR